MALATDLAFALDPVAMCRRAGTEPDPWQAEVLRSRKEKVILLAGRQVGKSTVVSFAALNTALYAAPVLVLVMARRLQQAGELFRKIKEAYARLAREADVCPVRSSTERRLEFENGSRIQCVAANADDIRGFTPGLVIVDEAAFVPDQAYETLRPMLAVSKGRLMLLSTAGARQGFFHEDWTEGDPAEWLKLEVPATLCPRITPEFLARERERLGERVFAMEYMCQFGDLATALFAFEDIQAMFATEGSQHAQEA
jgi:hypothetical protein